MKTVKNRLTFITITFFVTSLVAVLTGCSHSPKKPEWVEKGAERETSGGMIRHTGVGSGPDRDVAIFQARSNAIQAIVFECGGISPSQTVIRKSWVEPVMDPKDDEKIATYQASVVAEVETDLCEEQQKAKIDPEKVRDNARVSGQQDTYERVMQVRNGLPDDYFLKERAIAAVYATREDTFKMIQREKLEREEDRREILNEMEDMTGKTAGNKKFLAMNDSAEIDPPEMTAMKNKCDGQLDKVSDSLGGAIYDHNNDRSHPTTAPLYELESKMVKRCDGIYDGKIKEITWDFNSEYADALSRSSKIDVEMNEQSRRLGHPTVADSPRNVPSLSDKIRDDGIPKTSMDKPDVAVPAPSAAIPAVNAPVASVAPKAEIPTPKTMVAPQSQVAKAETPSVAQGLNPRIPDSLVSQKK